MNTWAIFRKLNRQKLTEEQIAELFVATTFESVENGWPLVAEFLNENPHFIQSPELDPEDYGKFLLAVVVANLQSIPKHFEAGVDRRLVTRICAKFALAIGITSDEFTRKVSTYRSFMKQVNQPSKKLDRGMARLVMYKYQLMRFQDPYFSSMSNPDPQIERDLRTMMVHFLWDWEDFVTQYRVKPQPQL
jgi:hypothetical protein